VWKSGHKYPCDLYWLLEHETRHYCNREVDPDIPLEDLDNDKKVSKNLLLHAKEVEADRDEIKTYWEMGLYFWAGEKAGVIVDQLVWPIEVTEELIR